MVLVGAAHHRALMHSGVAADDVLYHGGEDFETVVADNETLDAGVEINEAVLVQISDVAGVDPDAAIGVAAEDYVRLVGLVVVALHGGGAGDAQLAALADGQLFVRTRLEGGDEGVDHRDADAAQLVVRAGGDGGSGGHLGHAVALGDRIADAMGGEEVVDGLLCAPGDGVAAGGVVEDEGEILIPQLGVSGQLLVVGGHAEHMLGLVLQHQTAQLGRVEIGDDDDREAQHQRQMDAAGVAVGDEGGHDVHELLAPVEQLVVGAELLRDGVEAVVGEHNALGRAGGAAGVDDDAGVVGVIRLRSGALALAALDELLPADDVGGIFVLVGGGQLVSYGHHRGQRVGRREDDDLFHVGALCGLTAALVHDVQADEKVGVHLFDILMDALDTVAGVHKVQGGTDHVRCIEQGNDLGGHDAHYRYDVALLDADAPQGGSSLLDVDDKVSVGELPAVVIQRGVIQMVFVPLADIFECRDGGKGLLNVLLVVIFEPRFGLGCVNRILRRHQFLIPLCL